MRFTESPNARSKSISTAEFDTHGVLNRHATKNSSYQVGVSEDKGNRRTMEDSHSFVTDFDNVRGQGFFAVFDGHAGKHAAEWCGTHFHESLLRCLRACPDIAIPDILNETFHDVDRNLSRMCEESDGKIHSGCTAVTAFLRLEDADGKQSFLDQATPPSKPITPLAETPSPLDGDDSSSGESGGDATADDSKDPKRRKKTKKSGAKRLRNAIKSLGSVSSLSPKASPSVSRKQSVEAVQIQVPAQTPPPEARRVFYTANAGDARGVLCRNGNAIRLTYDHKGSDKQEAKRIMDAGGFVMSGRVNGVLAVTRSLGDSSMKEFVVGAPYTTETELCDDDEFVILACDGLWDVASDQAAVDLIRDIDDAQLASQKLLKYALSHHSSDNVTVLVVRFKNVFPKTA
ncbi:phosphatase 2C-like domain-containing protein [Desarmillaria tabescens]|uniref:Phosphatase 2C-like domain-containing protein n=1 Tax=Armillaria tabescens TaxID=1929756 RepID=A0AA39K6J2_ARMTA|nr:phosphatase 2C-like domain-containing protein [Desarmillaria tabescens]KAK0455425.1 phosphatase 2C-like domain-containing protein [Desarmillaria tabescens]